MAKGYWLSVTNFSSETYQHQMPEFCKRGLAVAENVWENHHPIHWEETTILEDRSCWWRRPSTSRWHPWRSASTEMEDWESLIAGPLWWGQEQQSSPTFDLQWHVCSVVESFLAEMGKRTWKLPRYSAVNVMVVGLLSKQRFWLGTWGFC